MNYTFLDETLDFFKQYGLSEEDVAYCRIFDNFNAPINVTFENFKIIIKRINRTNGNFNVNPSIRIVFKNGDFACRNSYILEIIPSIKRTVHHWNYIVVPLLNVSITTISASEAIKGINYAA